MRLLVDEGEEPQAVPPSVRDVIARRLTRLTPQGRDLLVLASVLGREFGLDVLARLAGRRRVLGVLDEAIASGLLADVPGAAGRLRFEHALVRDTLYDGLTVARRMRLHERAVEALERLTGAPGAARWPSSRSTRAPPATTPRRCAAPHATAPTSRSRRTRYEEAVRLYGLALDALERLRPPEPHERLALLMAAGDALASAGSTAASKARFLAAAEAARSARRAVELARAALGYGGRTVWQRAGDDLRLVPLLEEALAAIGESDRALRCRLLDAPGRSAARPAVARAALVAERGGGRARPRDSATRTCSQTRSSRISWPPGARTSTGSCRWRTRSASWPAARAGPRRCSTRSRSTA